jgi:GNAT superfamily N-acetyltransferase
MSGEHLTHGWEPDLDPKDSVLRQYVLASADRGDRMAEAAGGRHERDAQLALADAGSPVLFDNAAVLLQPPGIADVEDAARRAAAWFPPDRHAVLLSAWPTPDLRAHGWELMGHPPLMLRTAGGAPPPVPDGLEIRQVTTQADLDEFLTTLVEAYPMPGGEGSPVGAAALAGGDISLFVGALQGRAVATSGAFVGHGINDVEWIATRPEARGRGIGAALTWAATTVLPDAPAMLIASDDGQPVYERLGYVRLLRLTLWHRPPSTG